MQKSSSTSKLIVILV